MSNDKRGLPNPGEVIRHVVLPQEEFNKAQRQIKKKRAASKRKNKK